jgi:hypothetical protein
MANSTGFSSSRGNWPYGMSPANSRCSSASRCVVACAVFASLALTACTEKAVPEVATTALPTSQGPAASSTKVTGVEPAGPTADSASASSPAKSDVSKAQESSAMPMPGQANDHSVLGPKPVQKSTSR